MLSRLNCGKCGHPAAEHEDVSSAHVGDDADLIDDDGKRFKVVFTGGGGAHDAPEVEYQPL